MLFNMAGSKDMSLVEVDEAAKIIKNKVSPQAKIIFGALYDKTLKAGEVKITVIATGFGK